MLLYHGADPAARTRSGLTPVHIAAESGNVRCLKALLSYDAPIDVEDNSGVRPLEVAQIYGHESFVEFLTSTMNLMAEDKHIELETHDIKDKTRSIYQKRDSATKYTPLKVKEHDNKGHTYDDKGHTYGSKGHT